MTRIVCTSTILLYSVESPTAVHHSNWLIQIDYSQVQAASQSQAIQNEWWMSRNGRCVHVCMQLCTYVLWMCSNRLTNELHRMACGIHTTMQRTVNNCLKSRSTTQPTNQPTTLSIAYTQYQQFGKLEELLLCWTWYYFGISFDIGLINLIMRSVDTFNWPIRWQKRPRLQSR